MEDQKSIYPKYFIERGSKKRISEGLGVKDLPHPALFKKDSHGPGINILVIADEVFFGVFKIHVLGQALGHGIIGSLIGE
jgi:hypothetical protein